MKATRARHLFKHTLPVLLILLIAGALRFSDLNWDQSQYNHPDERHVTNVISQLQMPESAAEYFDSGVSPLNPYNNRQSWVYGTLPLFSGRVLAEFLDAGCAPKQALLQRALGRLLFGDVLNSVVPAGCNAGFFTGYDMLRLIGRFLSAVADIFTVLAVYLTGRRLFGWRAGLLAAAFSAFTVLQIQHSKFFVVESLLTMCTAWCLYFCARIVTTSLSPSRKPFGLWGNAILAGLFSGFAVACKISVWPTAALVVLSILIAMWRDRRGSAPAALDAMFATLLAGVVTFVGFRVAQPYAFVGNSAVEWKYTLHDCTELDDTQMQICAQTQPMPASITRLVAGLPEIARPILAPSSRWVSELQQASYNASGESDPPFGWQWANRAPVTFPLINIVFYGLGLPLGLAMLLGIVYMLRQLLRGRRWWAYLVPVLWTIGFFLYQGTQYVKSIRYQLPIYPMLCVIAAAVLVAIWRRIGRRLTAHGHPPLLGRIAAFVPAGAVLAGTAAWALAFMQIYDGELTRTEASRWIYANAPTALTISGDSNGAARSIHLPVTQIALAPGSPFITTIRLNAKDEDLSAPLKNVSFTLNRVSGEAEILARLIDATTQQPMRQVTQRVAPGASTIRFDSVEIGATQDYVIELSANSGQLNARTTALANQHWDEGIPFRIGGKDAYGGYYVGLQSVPDNQMLPYLEEDPYIDANNPGKLTYMLNGMDDADLIILNSNRHYGSVARLPWRFPMTNRYYEALMGGELGFELAADFYRFPRIGPFVFNDQEMPQFLARPANVAGTPPGIEVPYPTAEEAFSVYDHPRVLIFKKTPAYSRAKAEAILGVYDLSRSLKRSAFASSNTPGGLLLDQKTLAAQRAGGTWSELYPRNSPLNQSQPVAVLAWLALIEALGLAGFLLLASFSRHSEGSRAATLADGGFALGKTLGLLLVAFVAWFLASLQFAKFDRPTLIVVTGAVLAVAAAVGHLNRAHIIELVKSRWRLMLVAELVFLISFGVWIAVRSANPDLWHPYRGGEKPMEMAYLNSILKATYFPPQDPWFAGGYINYYYFGFVVIGWPIKLLGIDPAVAFNIAVPTLFALTAVGAYGIAATLADRWTLDSPQKAAAGAIPAMRRSSSPAILAGLAAALFVVYLGNTKQLDIVGPGLKQLGGATDTGVAPLAWISGFAQWLGGAQLPVGPDQLYWNATRPAPEVMIAEFPNFTFLYADLHPHMIVMPLAFLALGAALAFALGGRRTGLIALASVIVGALWPTNTWDFFPYLLLAAGGLVIGRLDKQAGGEVNRWIRAAVAALPSIVVFALLARALFAPYHEHFGSGYNQIEPWLTERTQVDTYLAIHGLFLLPIVIGLLRHMRLLGPGRESFAAGARKAALLALLLGALIGAFLTVRSAGQRVDPAISTTAYTSLISAPLIALAFAAALRAETDARTRLRWLMVGGALALTLFVEHFTLRGDIGRMNTQFKFYIIVWLLLGTTAAATLIGLLREIFERRAPAPASETPALALAADAPAMARFEAPMPETSFSSMDSVEAEFEPTTFETIEDAARVDLPAQPEAPTEPAELADHVDGVQPVAAVETAEPTTPEKAPVPMAALEWSVLTAFPFKLAFSAAVAVLVFIGLLYPAFAIPARVSERYSLQTPRGLDGMAYMTMVDLAGYDLDNGQAPYALRLDYEAMRWLQDNVQGSPTIIEGTAGGKQYTWASRYAIYTGLPTIVGWQWHQRQQRGESLLDSRVIYDRFTDVETFYSSPDAAAARAILKRYGVRYVIVSAYERIYYSPAGFAKFEQMAADGELKSVFTNSGVTIYEVTQ